MRRSCSLDDLLVFRKENVLIFKVKKETKSFFFWFE